MSGSFTPMAGGCACGSVRYELDRAPLIVHCCHCRDCQRQTGSAFVINALIETTHLLPRAGAPKPVAMPTASGRPHDVFRCPDCGTALWSDYGGRGWMRFMRVGTLDDPAALAPDVHIYARSRLPWVRIPDGAAVFAAYYDLDAVWPAESLARLRSARQVRTAVTAAGRPRESGPTG